MQKPLFGHLIACIMFLTAACMGGSEEPTPTPTAPPATVAPSAVVQPPQAVQEMPAPAATPTDGAATAMPTRAAAPTVAPPNLIALAALNIRGGPGIDYPLIGNLAQDGDAPVLGRTDNRSWYRIECPEGLDAPECWVIGDEALVRIESAPDDAGAPADAAVAVVPTPLAPPTPAATPAPAAPPCVVNPPPGWVRYTIANGDTVYSIAVRHGVTMAQLIAVNCLGDVLFADDSLFVPQRSAAAQAGGGTGTQTGDATGASAGGATGASAGGATGASTGSATGASTGSATGASTGSATGIDAGVTASGGSASGASAPSPAASVERQVAGTAVVMTSTPSAGAVLDFAFVSPFSFSCPSAPDTPAFVKSVPGISSRSFILDDASTSAGTGTDDSIISKGNAVLVYVCNVDAATPVTGIAIQRQGAADAVPLFFARIGESNNYRARWAPRNGNLTGDYVTTATLDNGEELVGTFTLSAATLPTIAVDPDSVAIGQNVDVILAGFEPGTHVLHIYRTNSLSGMAQYAGRIEGVWVGDSGETVAPLAISAEWPAGGYIIDLGDNPGVGEHGIRRLPSSENVFRVSAP